MLLWSPTLYLSHFPTHLLTDELTHSLTHSSINPRPPTHPHTHARARDCTFSYLLTHSLIHSFTHLLTHVLNLSPFLALNHWVSCSLYHLLTCSLSCSLYHSIVRNHIKTVQAEEKESISYSHSAMLLRSSLWRHAIHFKAVRTVVCRAVLVAVVAKTTILRARYEAFMYCLWHLTQLLTFLHSFAAFVLVQVRLIVWVGHLSFISIEELLFHVAGQGMHTDGANWADLLCSVKYCLHLGSHQLQLRNAGP